MPDTFILANDAASVYLLNREQHRFFEISEANNRMRIRRGEVGRACVVYRMSWVTQRKGREQFLCLVAAWKEKGFAEAEPEAEITEACEATELFAADIEDHPVFSRFFSLGWSAELRGTRKRIMLFPNGFSYDGDFDVEEMADTGLINGLIIQGDVRVSGVFSQLTYTYPGSILITGSVYAHSLGHKDSHMVIDGDLRADNIVYGEYNDGQLGIGGDVHGKAWISDDHAMWASGTKYLPSINTRGADDLSEYLSPKVLDLHGGLDQDALRQFIFAGKCPLRKGYVFTPPVPPPLPHLAAATPEKTWDQSEQIESFADAHPDVQTIVRAMVGVPGARATLKLLETPPPLHLIRPHSNILLVNALLKNKDFPGVYRPVIERLLELGADPRLTRDGKKPLINEVLAWENSDIAELMHKLYPAPEWQAPVSGQVEEPSQAHPSMRRFFIALSEGASHALAALQSPPDPALIANHSMFLLINTLAATQRDPAFVAVTERLLELGADPKASTTGSISPVQFAESARMRPTLDLFYARDPSLTPLPFSGREILLRLLEWEDAGVDWDAPERRSWLESIEEIGIVAETLPRLPHALGRLSRLKSLKLIGVTLNDATVPESIGDLSTLTHLFLTEVGLSAIPESFGRLISIQHLNLAMNQLTTIPDAIAELPNLVELDLTSNPLTRLPDLSRLTQRLNRLALADTPFHELSMIRLKEAQFIKRKRKPQKKRITDDIRKVLADVGRLYKKAHNLQTSDPEKAYALFGQARAMAEAYAQDFPEELGPSTLAALAGELWCTNELAGLEDETRGIWTASSAMDLAREILVRTNAIDSFYYTAEGELKRNSRTLAHNTLGYYLLQSGEQLDEALTHINEALAETDYKSGDETFAVVLENKVRILLALKHDDDAYGVVYQMRRRFPDVPFFAEIAATPEYQRWDMEN